MPAMANITVKKYDGTTDIVFDAIQSSGGDNSPAVWRQDTGNNAAYPVAVRPSLSLKSGWNGPKTARQLRYSFVFPYVTQDIWNAYIAKHQIVGSGIITIPTMVPVANSNEATYQGMNLLGSLLIRQALASGYAPT